MDLNSKRKGTMDDDCSPTKRVKKECSYGEGCYRRNPAHFREFSHRHLEAILDASSGDGDYPIPEHLSLQQHQIIEQLEVIIEKLLYTPKKNTVDSSTNAPQSSTKVQNSQVTTESSNTSNSNTKMASTTSNSLNDTPTTSKQSLNVQSREKSKSPKEREKRSMCNESERDKKGDSGTSSGSNKVTGDSTTSNVRGPDYVPIVPPTRRPEDFLKVVRPKGKMADKHDRSAPYYIFYTTITDSILTHTQPYSVTFLELLDHSLGELKCSLQINFMVEISWLLAQYYFAGYSEKKLTILYGEDAADLRNITQKKPHVDAHKVNMATPFGKHHTKMMILCYEDGSLRVVVSTANLYIDDWENRTQGLWLSPACPELPAEAMPFEGDSPTAFKKSLLRYLHHYNMPQLSFYIERVKRCDFSHINVFLVASVPGGHSDTEWGLARVGALLRQHCRAPRDQNSTWPLVAQASSLGSYGKEPKLWLTGDFLHYFTKIKDQPQMLSKPAELKLIYPSLENVRQSHDGLLGGGCLPYAGDAHAKQTWLNNFLYQWKATHTYRDRAMPHIKSYTRTDPDGNVAAFYLLTSANLSKAAWGTFNKGNGALRIMSYEAGVLFLPRFVINEDFFPLSPGSKNRLVIPYDLPPLKYSGDMSPWVQDYLRD